MPKHTHTRRKSRSQNEEPRLNVVSRRTCRRGHNFYSATNQEWQVATQIPQTESRITQAYFIRKEIDRELLSVMRAQRDGPIHDLLTSWRHSAKEDVPHGLTPLLQVMLSMRDPWDISSRIGWMIRHRMNAPIDVYVQGDPRDRKRCRIYIEEGVPGIGAPEYWLWSEHVDKRRAYARYVRSLATVTGIPGLIQGYGAEREYASVFPPMSNKKEHLNMLTWQELRDSYTGIDWMALLREVGLEEEQITGLQYNVLCPAFIHHIQARMKNWPIEKWCHWFALLVVQTIAGRSAAGPMRSAWFEYYQRFLQGIFADEPTEILELGIVQTLLPNVLAQLWVRDHCSDALKREIGQMIDHIHLGAGQLLERVTWMAPSTRKAALEKLRHMKINVCWPDRWDIDEVPVAGLSPINYVENLMTLSAQVTQRYLRQLKEKGGCADSAEWEWGRFVFEVNAFYYPEENRFVLPAAILRAPFYDSAASIPVNYGAIGATIGHELCHAFDSEGRMYDKDGTQRNWWTPGDAKDYKLRANAMIRLFESQTYRSLPVDGRLTLTENIADLGGLEFALEGARLALGRKLTKKELQEFFVSYSVSWRAKDRLKRAAQLLLTDSHAPPMLRVNHIVRQMDAWYEAFGLTPECKGYVPHDKRIRFFTE